MDMADLEASCVGNLARYCIRVGTIPPHSLRGLWWVNGECKGLGVVDWESDVEPIQPLINHLIYWAPYIIGTEGINDLLDVWENIRKESEKSFPREAENRWVGMEAAQKISKRGRSTIYEWIKSGSVGAIKDVHGILIEREGLELMKAAIKEGEKKRAAALNSRRS